MSYVPRRLIDMNILQNMALNNPMLNNTQSRLLNYELPKNIPIKVNTVEKEIEKIKTGGVKKIGPSILNGVVFVVTCLLIYWVLHYKYYKKKESIR
jgi:hypothetical protein